MESNSNSACDTSAVASIVYYLMEDQGASPDARDDEMDQIEWLALESAAARLTFENERAIVRLAAEALHSRNPT